jgi:hypothetical protein
VFNPDALKEAELDAMAEQADGDPVIASQPPEPGKPLY